MVKDGGPNYFQACSKLSDSKTFNKCYLIYQLIWEYNYKYIFVKIARSKLSELSNFPKFKFYFY